MNYLDFLDDESEIILKGKIKKKNTIHRTLDIDKLEKILEILENYGKKTHKRLNIFKMFNKINIPVQQRHDYLRIILRFQKIFHSFFTDRFLYIQSEGENLYFSTKKSKKSQEKPSSTKVIPEEITITKNEVSLLNDVVYMFTKVQRGRGFNLQETDSEIMKGIKSLRKNHPYLFFSNGHGSVYPTEFALKLGEKVNSYMKCNRRVKNVSVDNTIIIINW